MLEGKNIHEKCKNFCIFIVFVIVIVLPDVHNLPVTYSLKIAQEDFLS